jgi:hypothetical protein
MCGGEERCTQGLGAETWGKSPLARPRHRWEDKIDFNEVGRVAWAGIIWFRIGTGSKLLLLP